MRNRYLFTALLIGMASTLFMWACGGSSYLSEWPETEEWTGESREIEIIAGAGVNKAIGLPSKDIGTIVEFDSEGEVGQLAETMTGYCDITHGSVSKLGYFDVVDLFPIDVGGMSVKGGVIVDPPWREACAEAGKNINRCVACTVIKDLPDNPSWCTLFCAGMVPNIPQVEADSFGVSLHKYLDFEVVGDVDPAYAMLRQDGTRTINPDGHDTPWAEFDAFLTANILTTTPYSTADDFSLGAPGSACAMLSIDDPLDGVAGEEDHIGEADPSANRVWRKNMSVSQQATYSCDMKTRLNGEIVIGKDKQLGRDPIVLSSTWCNDKNDCQSFAEILFDMSARAKTEDASGDELGGGLNNTTYINVGVMAVDVNGAPDPSKFTLELVPTQLTKSNVMLSVVDPLLDDGEKPQPALNWNVAYAAPETDRGSPISDAWAQVTPVDAWKYEKQELVLSTRHIVADEEGSYIMQQHPYTKNFVANCALSKNFGQNLSDVCYRLDNATNITATIARSYASGDNSWLVITSNEIPATPSLYKFSIPATPDYVNQSMSQIQFNMTRGGVMYTGDAMVAKFIDNTAGYEGQGYVFGLEFHEFGGIETQVCVAYQITHDPDNPPAITKGAMIDCSAEDHFKFRLQPYLIDGGPAIGFRVSVAAQAGGGAMTLKTDDLLAQVGAEPYPGLVEIGGPMNFVFVHMAAGVPVYHDELHGQIQVDFKADTVASFFLKELNLRGLLGYDDEEGASGIDSTDFIKEAIDPEQIAPAA